MKPAGLEIDALFADGENPLDETMMNLELVIVAEPGVVDIVNKVA